MTIKAKEKKTSPYQLLNRWLYDGSKQSQLPAGLINDKVIPNTILLYHFQCSKYILYISKIFNSFDLYQMNKVDIFKFMKKCVLDSGYKPPFIPRVKTTKNKLSKILKFKFPYLKLYEVDMLVDKIDESPDKDRIYESVGLYTKATKKKLTKADKEKIKKLNTEKQEKKEEPEEEKVSLDDVMANFGT